MAGSKKRNTKFYKCGDRPVIVNIYDDYKDYLAMNWETGIFEEDFRYSNQISLDPSGDVEEMSKENFNSYLLEIKKRK